MRLDSSSHSSLFRIGYLVPRYWAHHPESVMRTNGVRRPWWGVGELWQQEIWILFSAPKRTFSALGEIRSEKTSSWWRQVLDENKFLMKCEQEMIFLFFPNLWKRSEKFCDYVVRKDSSDFSLPINDFHSRQATTKTTSVNLKFYKLCIPPAPLEFKQQMFAILLLTHSFKEYFQLFGC